MANKGFKLKPEFSFKLQLPDYNTSWIEITQDDFQPITKNLNLYIDVTAEDFQLAGIDLNKSLVYRINDEYGEPIGYIFLLGGFNDYKLIFRVYEIFSTDYDGTYGDDNLYSCEFSYRIYDDYGEPLGYVSLLNDLMFTAESEEDLEPNINNSFLPLIMLILTL